MEELFNLEVLKFAFFALITIGITYQSFNLKKKDNKEPKHS